MQTRRGGRLLHLLLTLEEEHDNVVKAMLPLLIAQEERSKAGYEQVVRLQHKTKLTYKMSLRNGND